MLVGGLQTQWHKQKQFKLSDATRTQWQIVCPKLHTLSMSLTTTRNIQRYWISSPQLQDLIQTLTQRKWTSKLSLPLMDAETRNKTRNDAKRILATWTGILTCPTTIWRCGAEFPTQPPAWHNCQFIPMLDMLMSSFRCLHVAALHPLSHTCSSHKQSAHWKLLVFKTNKFGTIAFLPTYLDGLAHNAPHNAQQHNNATNHIPKQNNKQLRL